jgi:HD-like signal output (HDOD) protein
MPAFFQNPSTATSKRSSSARIAQLRNYIINLARRYRDIEGSAEIKSLYDIKSLDEEAQIEILRKIPQFIDELSTHTAKILDLINSTYKLRSDKLKYYEAKREKLKIVNSFKTDVVLNCKLIEAAKSPYFSIRNFEKIGIDRLIELIGPIEMGRILMNILYVSSKRTPRDNTYGVNSKTFWLHSTGVGLCLETFYDYLNEDDKVKVQNIFTATRAEEIYSYLFLIGIFHDIGKVVLSQKLHPLYKIVIENQQKINKDALLISTVDIEKKFFNFTHVEIGEELLKNSLCKTPDNKLFEIIIETMKCHHNLMYDAKEYNILGKLLYLANRFLQTDVAVAEYGLALANKTVLVEIEKEIKMHHQFTSEAEKICGKIEVKLFDTLNKQGLVSNRNCCIIDTESRQKEIEKEFKIFIGSTFEDLKAEREAVISVLNELKEIFWSMEFSHAAPYPPIEVCLDAVSKSEIYIGIIGQKYGSVPKGQKLSYTELEYAKAEQHNLKRFVYLRGQNALIPFKSMESNCIKLKKPNNFVKKIK